MWKLLLISALCQAAFGASLNNVLRPRYRRSNPAFHDPWFSSTDYSDFDDFHEHGSYPHDASFPYHGSHHDHGHDHSYHGHGYDHGFPSEGYHDYHGHDHGPWKNGHKHDHAQCTVQYGHANSNKKTPWNTRTQTTTTSTEDPLNAARLRTSICMRSCPVTSEYNPVCGTNDVTYNNLGRLECAKSCGIDVSVKKPTSCRNNAPSPTTTSPQLTTTHNARTTTQTPEPFNPTRYTTIDVSLIDFDSSSTMGIPAPVDKVIDINTILPNKENSPTVTTINPVKLPSVEPSASTLGNEGFTDGTDNTDGSSARPTARPPFTVPTNVIADIFTNSPGFDTTLDEQIDFDVRTKEDGSIVFPDD